MKLTVNNEGVIANLARTFSHDASFIAELLQNARRAGATCVGINYDIYGTDEGNDTPNQFTITDDGVGITSGALDTLLTVASSGWNPESNEQPYGLGFLACLFAANHVTVSSNNRLLSFNTKDVLDGAEVELQSALTDGTTVIVLDLNKRLKGDDITDAVKGFPLVVYYNGNYLSRPDAPHPSDINLPGIGKVSRSVFVEDSLPTIRIYYQYIFVGSSSGYAYYRGNNSKYIHLDQGAFDAKQPDRNTLINFKAACEKIRDAVITEKRKQLDRELDTADHKEFITANIDTIVGWRLTAHFYAKCDYWRFSLYEFSFPPYLDDNDTRIDDYAAPTKEILRIDDNEHEYPPVYAIDWDGWEEGFFPLLMWFYEAEHLVILPQMSLSATPDTVIMLDRDNVKITVTTGQPLVTWTGTRGSFDVAICDSVELTIVKSDDDGGGFREPEDASVTCSRPFYDSNDDVIYWPKNEADASSHIWSLLRQTDSYINDAEILDEHELEEDISSFARFINFHLHGDEEGYLKDALNEADIPAPFYNTTCEISFGEYGKVTRARVISRDVIE